MASHPIADRITGVIIVPIGMAVVGAASLADDAEAAESIARSGPTLASKIAMAAILILAARFAVSALRAMFTRRETDEGERQ